jgi:hypothetical protein
MERLDFDLPLQRFVGLGTQNNLASVILGISSQLEDLSVPLGLMNLCLAGALVSATSNFHVLSVSRLRTINPPY